MSYEKLINEIKRASTIAVFCHKNPDGDTIGSGLALFFALKNLGKTTDIFCEDIPGKNFKDLSGVEFFNAGEKKRYDLSIAVDCGDEGRLGTEFERFLRAKTTAVIDHHKTNNKFGDINTVELTASCAEIMYRVLSELGAEINAQIAALLYMGIMTDSGGFSFNSVTERTLKTASELVALGANAGEIAYKYFKRTEKNVFDLRMRALNGVRFFSDDKIAILHLTAKDFEITKTTVKDTEGVVNTVLNIDTVQIAMTVADFLEQQFKISMRSKNDVDVSRMAAFFGGGGHKNASGCQMSGCYEDVLDRLLKVANDYL